MLWTEWELVSILCGLPPVSPDVVQSDEQRLDAATRRADATRHVEDGRLVGHLAVVERTIANEEIAAARLYADVRRFRVASAIRWALSNRLLFPGCPLNEEHLAIAEAAAVAAGAAHSFSTAPVTFENLHGPKASLTSEAVSMNLAVNGGTGSRSDVLQRRAEWLLKEMHRRDLNGASLKPLDRKTVRKILDGKEVSRRTLETLAQALEIAVQAIPGAPPR